MKNTSIEFETFFLIIVEQKTYLSRYRLTDEKFDISKLVLDQDNNEKYDHLIKEHVEYENTMNDLIKKFKIVDDCFYMQGEMIIIKFKVEFQEKDKLDLLMMEMRKMKTQIIEHENVLKMLLSNDVDFKGVLSSNDLCLTKYHECIIDGGEVYSKAFEVYYKYQGINDKINFSFRNRYYLFMYMSRLMPSDKSNHHLYFTSINYCLDLITEIVKKLKIEKISIIDLSNANISSAGLGGSPVNTINCEINDEIKRRLPQIVGKKYPVLKKYKIDKLILPKNHGCFFSDKIKIFINLTENDRHYLEHELETTVVFA